MADTGAKAVKNMSFEDALKELEAVVTRLESADVPLEESITLYERGDILRKHCESKLKDAEERVLQIIKGADGKAEAQPVEIS